MPAELVLTPEVERDLAEALAWYEARQPGLDDEFLRCVDACIHSILRNPEKCGVVFEGFRRGLVRRFPYAIFYEFQQGTVTLYGIFHPSRDPQKWRQRLSGA